MTDSDDIVTRIAAMDPWTYSLEGLDDGCYWCDADANSRAIGWPRSRDPIHHDDDCLWAQCVRTLTDD